MILERILLLVAGTILWLFLVALVIKIHTGWTWKRLFKEAFSLFPFLI